MEVLKHYGSEKKGGKMDIEGPDQLLPILNKQFEMLGLKIKFSDLPEDGIVQNGKRKDNWYDVYKFTEEQEAEWRKWAWDQVKGMKDMDYWMTYAELRYGFVVRYTRKGELF
jgi:hypothetical protein